MFSIFFSWIRHQVTQAVFAGLADAAEQLDKDGQQNAAAVAALKSRVLALAGNEPVKGKTKGGAA